MRKIWCDVLVTNQGSTGWNRTGSILEYDGRSAGKMKNPTHDICRVGLKWGDAEGWCTCASLLADVPLAGSQELPSRVAPQEPRSGGAGTMQHTIST